MRIPTWNVQTSLPKCKCCGSDAHWCRSLSDSLFVRSDLRLAVNLRFPSDSTFAECFIILSSLTDGQDTGWFGSAHHAHQLSHWHFACVERAELRPFRRTLYFGCWRSETTSLTCALDYDACVCVCVCEHDDICGFHLESNSDATSC